MSDFVGDFFFFFWFVFNGVGKSYHLHLSIGTRLLGGNILIPFCMIDGVERLRLWHIFRQRSRRRL